MVTFRVDDVVPAADPLPTQLLGELFSDALALGGDPTLPVVEPWAVHPLVCAVGRAFADHRPLVFSPDAVWLTIVQGLAQHIRLNAERLRPQLVRHTGRERLTVSVEGPMPRDADSWQHVVEAFEKQVGGLDLFECDFSTSTQVERVAGKIVLLDAYSPYFTYLMRAVCGIPSITLTGTVEDWRKIRTRIDGIAELDAELEPWCRSLRPIADQLAAAAASTVDVEFWKRIYNPFDAYGGEVITGWITRLYPYLRMGGEVDTPNPMLELPIDEPRDITPVNGYYDGPGVRSSSIPATLSQATITVNDQASGDNRSVAVHAGLVAVAQDAGGALRPVAGWHLAPATVRIEDVVDRIEREHTTTPAAEVRYLSGVAEVIAVYRRIGSASLFDGAWQLLPLRQHRHAGVSRHAGVGGRAGVSSLWLGAVIDLPDGRSICAVTDTFADDVVGWAVARIVVDDERSSVLLPAYQVADDPAEIRVYGTSLAILLETALDSGGDFADLETGRLDQLMAS